MAPFYGTIGPESRLVAAGVQRCRPVQKIGVPQGVLRIRSNRVGGYCRSGNGVFEEVDLVENLSWNGNGVLLDADSRASPDSIPISFLRPGYSPRSNGEDENHIRILAESGPSSLPPILVHKTSMRVIDGMHRLRAAMLNGCDRIDVEYFDGSDEEAFCRAVELNVSHGLPLSLTDRKTAAARILAWRPELSDRATAAVTGLSPKTVAVIRRRACEGVPQRRERLGSDGRRRPLNGVEGRRRAAEVIVGRPEASLREIAATAGISPGTARRVREQLAAGRDVTDDRHPSNKARQGTGQPAASGSEAPSATRDSVSPARRCKPGYGLCSPEASQ